MAGFVAGTVRAVTSTSQILAGAYEVSRNLVELLKPASARFDPDEAHYLFCIQRQIECLIGPLELCMSTGYQHHYVAQRTISVVEDTLRRVLHCIRKLRTASHQGDLLSVKGEHDLLRGHPRPGGPTQGVLKSGGPRSKTSNLILLKRCLDELDIAVSQLTLSLAALKLVRNESQCVPELQKSVQRSELNALSISTLLKAAKRLWEMENKSGDICLQPGQLYYQECVPNPKHPTSCLGSKWIPVMASCFLRIFRKHCGSVAFFFELCDDSISSSSLPNRPLISHRAADAEFLIVSNERRADSTTTTLSSLGLTPVSSSLMTHTTSFETVGKTPTCLKFSSEIASEMRLFYGSHRQPGGPRDDQSAVCAEMPLSSSSLDHRGDASSCAEAGEWDESDKTDHQKPQFDSGVERTVTVDSGDDIRRACDPCPETEPAKSPSQEQHRAQSPIGGGDEAPPGLGKPLSPPVMSHPEKLSILSPTFLSNDSELRKPYIVWSLQTFATGPDATTPSKDPEDLLDKQTSDWIRALLHQTSFQHTCRSLPAGPCLAFAFPPQSEYTSLSHQVHPSDKYAGKPQFNAQTHWSPHLRCTPLEVLYVVRLVNSYDFIFSSITPPLGKESAQPPSVFAGNQAASLAHLPKGSVIDSLLDNHPASVSKADDMIRALVADCVLYDSDSY